ncbi:MAG: RidA family protein [Nitrospinae bacterium]|nr:RidA family protein [Nitrospinota bacterium]
MSIADRMNELGIELPDAPAPVGAYVPYVISGSLMFVSGQIPIKDGAMIHEGKVPLDVSIEQGQECAALCFLNAIAQAKSALGDLERVERIVRMTGYVAVAQDFTAQPLVVNGASNLAVEIFGERGLHARVAVGVTELPLGAPVELEVILEVK